MKSLNKVIFVLSTVAFIGCQASNKSNDNSEEHVTLSYTVWTDKTELFVEFKPQLRKDPFTVFQIEAPGDALLTVSKFDVFHVSLANCSLGHEARVGQWLASQFLP